MRKSIITMNLAELKKRDDHLSDMRAVDAAALLLGWLTPEELDARQQIRRQERKIIALRIYRLTKTQ